MKKLLIIGLGFVLASCSISVEQKELIGQWVMRNDTIEIKKDGTFIHHFNGLINSGKWKLNSIGNEIDFEGFSYNSGTSSAHWYSRVMIEENEIHLIYSSDTSNGYYKKTEN